MPSIGRETARTGIDVGTQRVKLVRGVGARRLERITHVGAEDWAPEGTGDDAERAADALRRLLTRLELGRRQLGRLAAGIGGSEASVREAATPLRTPKELRQALPFEARKHLDLEGMASPVFAAQILGPAPEEEGMPDRARVLFAAVSRPERDFALRVLGRVRVEPSVVDLEPLALLNAVLADSAAPRDPDVAVGVLDLGGRRAVLHAAARSGGFLTRAVGDGVPGEVNEAASAAFARDLLGPLRETLTFYRGRHRREIERVFLAGGGAYLHRIGETLQAGLDRPVSVLDPLAGLADAAFGHDRDLYHPACFATACGLCRWWDTPGPEADHV